MYIFNLFGWTPAKNIENSLECQNPKLISSNLYLFLERINAKKKTFFVAQLYAALNDSCFYPFLALNCHFRTFGHELIIKTETQKKKGWIIPKNRGCLFCLVQFTWRFFLFISGLRRHEQEKILKFLKLQKKWPWNFDFIFNQ